VAFDGHIEVWADGLSFASAFSHARVELRNDATIMALAGHVSRKMLEHYSHVRQEAKREAVNMLSAKRPNKPTKNGYDTNRDTKPLLPEQVPPYVIEGNGRHEETRTPDLYRVNLLMARNSLKLHGTNRASTLLKTRGFDWFGPLMDPLKILNKAGLTGAAARGGGCYETRKSTRMLELFDHY
jgi:hypothetical protein